jgi:hypothetical protein
MHTLPRLSIFFRDFTHNGYHRDHANCASTSLHISLKTGFNGEGVVTLEPTMTARGVTLPLLDGNTVKNTFRMTADLKPGAFHPIGQCL